MRPWLARALWAALCALIGLSGCSGGNGSASSGKFYPPLPNKPRLQYLGSYSSATDVELQGPVEDFLIGKETVVPTLRKPNSAVIIKDRIVVADTGARALLVFDLEKGEFRPFRGDDGEGKVKSPLQVAVSGDGTVYVADGGRGQVLSYDSNEKFMRAYGAENEVKPAGVAVFGDTLYVCDRDRHQVVVFDRRTGLVMRRIGAEGREPGKFYIPTSIAVGSTGDIYVSEVGNFRVQRLRPDGTSVRVYGGLGDAPGAFTRPRGVAVGPDGVVYVVDAAFENVQAFDQSGRLLLFFGGPGNNAGEFVLPSGISVSKEAIAHFAKRADPRFTVQYLVAVVSQYGPNRISIFGFGDWKGPYQESATPPPSPAVPAPVAPPSPAPAGPVSIPAVPKREEVAPPDAPAPGKAPPRKALRVTGLHSGVAGSAR